MLARAYAFAATLVISGPAESRPRACPVLRCAVVSTLAGAVVDSAGEAIPSVEVALIDRGVAVRITRSDRSGHFALDDAPPDTATLRVRRIGYLSRMMSVRRALDGAAEIRIVMATVPAMPDTIRVSETEGDRGLAEFRERAASNHAGHFLDEALMRDLHPQLASDALRRVPGVVVRPGSGIGNIVRIRGCAPLIWVNGQRARGAELDDVARGGDVAAVEVYSSIAGVPARYADRSATCGTVLVWLRTR